MLYRRRNIAVAENRGKMPLLRNQRKFRRSGILPRKSKNLAFACNQLENQGRYSRIWQRLPAAIGDAAFAQIIGCQLNRDFVTGENADVILAHFS